MVCKPIPECLETTLPRLVTLLNLVMSLKLVTLLAQYPYQSSLLGCCTLLLLSSLWQHYLKFNWEQKSLPIHCWCHHRWWWNVCYLNANLDAKNVVSWFIFINLIRSSIRMFVWCGLLRSNAIQCSAETGMGYPSPITYHAHSADTDQASSVVYRVPRNPMRNS